MKVAIVYASTTGNTESMANAIKEAVDETGAEVYFSTADSASAADTVGCDVILLGSPAMGDEVLEDSAEAFFSGIEGQISGKNIGLFGSYDWGDGQWLRDWQDRVESCGGKIVVENLQIQLTPEDDGLAKCKDWAKSAL